MQLTEDGKAVFATIRDDWSGDRHDLTVSVDGTGRPLKYRWVPDKSHLEYFFENLSFVTHEGVWYPSEVRNGMVDHQEYRGDAGTVFPPGQYAWISKIFNLQLDPDISSEYVRIQRIAADPEVIFTDGIERKRSRHPQPTIQRLQKSVAEGDAVRKGKGREQDQLSDEPVQGVVINASPPASGIWWYVVGAVVAGVVCLISAILLQRQQT
jgi:hypothetical protein